MDPGNWATDLEGGSKFGYTLIWVLLVSNIAAIVLQTLAARLGIVTGRDLAQACRDHYPRSANYILWVLAEIGIVACDLAEVLGGAIGINLLFGIPLLWGVIITGLDALLFLAIQNTRGAKIREFHSVSDHRDRFVLRNRNLLVFSTVGRSSQGFCSAHIGRSPIHCYGHHRSNGDAPQFYIYIPLSCKVEHMTPQLKANDRPAVLIFLILHWL